MFMKNPQLALKMFKLMREKIKKMTFEELYELLMSNHCYVAAGNKNNLYIINDLRFFDFPWPLLATNKHTEKIFLKENYKRNERALRNLVGDLLSKNNRWDWHFKDITIKFRV